MKNLNGFNVKAVATRNEFHYYNATQANKCRNSGPGIQIVCLALQHMNAIITLKQSATIGTLDDFGEPVGPLRDVLKGSADVLMTMHSIKAYWRYQSYPFDQSSINIFSVSHKNSYVDSFLQIFNAQVCLFLLSVCLSVIVSLKFVLKLSLSKAALEYARIFVNAPSVRKPQKSLEKLCLIVSIVMTFTTSSYIQSRLSAINTWPNQVHINSIDDLVKSTLPVYVTSNHKALITDESILKRYHLIGDFPECGDRLVKYEQVACIEGKLWIGIYVRKNGQIYISDEEIAAAPVTYAFKKDSPLRDKVGLLSMRLTESGFFKVPLSKKSERTLWRKLHTEDTQDSMKDQIVCFFVLFGGWTLSIFIFTLESFIDMIKRKKQNIRFEYLSSIWKKKLNKNKDLQFALQRTIAKIHIEKNVNR